MATPQIKKPDFAYPKTVSEDASKVLERAIADHNDAIALQALIVRTIAEYDIDRAELQQSIRLVEEQAVNFADAPLAGLYDVLLARLYMIAYTDNRWVYDSRQLPLTPYPEDITEWSGDQYKAKMRELAMSATSADKMSRLVQVPVSRYPEIVLCPKISVPMFPTMADFAVSALLELTERINYLDSGQRYALIGTALTYCQGQVPAEIQWQCAQCKTLSDNFDKLIDIYDKYRDNEYSGLALALTNNGFDNIGRQKVFKNKVTEYLKKHRFGVFNGVLRYDLDNVELNKLTVRCPSFCAPNVPFEVKVNNRNALAYAVNVYYIGEHRPSNRNDGQYYRKFIKGNKPVQTVSLNIGEEVPFVNDTTLNLSLARPGYYVVIPVSKKTEIDYDGIAPISCIPVMPVSVLGADNKSQIIIVNAVDGSPVPNAKVKATHRFETLLDATTNDIGVIDYTKDMPWSATIDITAGGRTTSFDNDIRLLRNIQNDDEEVSVLGQVLTDRSLYHPGDVANVLCIVYRNQTYPDKTFSQELLSDTDVQIRLRDANWQEVDKVSGKTDSYGRCTTSFNLPTDGLTGRFTIELFSADGERIGSRQIMVSDYRMPDYEIKLNEVQCDVPSKGAVTISGTATSYSGMPIGDAELTLTLSTVEFWWRRGNSAPCYSAEFKTAADGTFSTVVPDSVFAANQAICYIAKVEGVSTTGSAATAEQTFALTAQYHIELSIADNNVDGERLFVPDVQVFSSDGSIAQLSLVWALKDKDNNTIVSGDFSGPIDLSTVTPGEYRFTVTAKETELANEATANITVYNVTSGITPNNRLWIKKNNYDLTGQNVVDIEYAVGCHSSTLYYILEANGDIVYTKTIPVSYGYHTLHAQLPEGINAGQIKLMCAANCAVYEGTVELTYQEQKSLAIECESFRDNLQPGLEETWTIRILDDNGHPVSAALALDMYNRALEALYPHSFSLNFHTPSMYSPISLSVLSAYDCINYAQGKAPKMKGVSFMYPAFNFYDTWLQIQLSILSVGDFYSRNYSSKTFAVGSAPMRMSKSEAVYECNGMVEDCAAEMPSMAPNAASFSDAIEEEVVEESAAEPIEMREAEVPMAIWAPTLSTDSLGNVQYTFNVPNANTTWRLKAVAWTHSFKTGSLMRDFIASKPVMVQPNLPRFMRSGDKATVIANVMNNSDSTATVTTTVQIFDPFTQRILSERKFTNVIDAKGSVTVSMPIEAAGDVSAVGYRVTSRCGRYADGEQSVIRILPSDAALVETKPFYLNPGETEYATKLPQGKDARLTLTFCENPAWTIVSALPGLRDDISDYANSAAAALYSAAIAQGIISTNPHIGDVLKQWAANPTDSALVSMLQKNEDLKIALLNATPWVLASQSDTERMANLSMIFDSKETNASINSAITVLEKLQMHDGGWAWGKWCDTSSLWVTSNVLAMLGDLTKLGWLPDNNRLLKMISKAVKFYDSKVEDTDLLYCLIRPLFSSISLNANGKKVIKATIDDILKTWKNSTDPAYKAMQAEALFLNDNVKKSHELMKSISEFGVYTKDQGLKFPSVNALYDYSILLEAFAMIEPESREVDGLRQQLIVRKQGSDWGSAVVTTQVVKSILTSGTRWTVDAKGATIVAGNETIKANSPIETATGSLKADLTKFAGKKLSVTTTGTGPAYGAVYAQFKQKMSDVKSSSCDDLSIEKQIFVRRGTEWENPKELKVGDRIKVQLTIHCKRNLQYVSIVDERPAAYEPVNQLPGWLWSEGVGFYRENRDTATDLHVIYMRPGTYLLTYEMNVNLAGEFSSGVASIQSQYAPELSAHSSGTIIRVK